MRQLTLVIGNKNYSSWSLRSWFLLKEMDVQFDELLLKLNTDEFEQRIGEYSPSRRVPVLRDGGYLIWDTLSIAEYLYEKFPEKHIWPQDLSNRILARSISAEMHSGFQAIRAHMPMNCRAIDRSVIMTDELQDDIDRIIEIWSECRATHAKSGSWLFGAFSIADAMYAPVAFRFASYGVFVDGLAKEYMQFLLLRPALQQWKQSSLLENEINEIYEVGLE